MVKGHKQLALAACRTLSAQAASLAGDASIAWRTLWQQGGGARYIISQTRESVARADNTPSTSCTADEASTIANHGRAQRRRSSDTGPPHSRLNAISYMGSSPPAPVAFTSRSILDLPRLSPLTLFNSSRPLHVSSSATAPAASGGQTGRGSGSGGSESASSGPAPPAAETATSAPPPVQNPLQAALAAASGSHPLAPSGQTAVAPKGRRRQKRNWMWYDENDEREERRYERAREQYLNVGTAYMSNITQSVKKLNRIIRLVRGLSYADAVSQCQMVPHKAARYVLQALEAAYQDATQAVGLNGDRLVVGIIYATRGRVEKAMQRMGRGRSGRMFTRTSHLRVALRESRGQNPAFQMRKVAPLMSVMTGATAPVASWLVRGSPAAPARAGTRPRFAYQVEV